MGLSVSRIISCGVFLANSGTFLSFRQKTLFLSIVPNKSGEEPGFQVAVVTRANEEGTERVYCPPAPGDRSLPSSPNTHMAAHNLCNFWLAQPRVCTDIYANKTSIHIGCGGSTTPLIPGLHRQRQGGSLGV